MQKVKEVLDLRGPAESFYVAYRIISYVLMLQPRGMNTPGITDLAVASIVLVVVTSRTLVFMRLI